VTAAATLREQVDALRRELLAAGVRPVRELSVDEARGQERARLRPGSAEPVAEVLERAVPGPAGDIAVRVYLPAARPAPVLVYFFGGGWVLGSVDAVDPTCRRLANATPCAVASVSYRRAPEHPFPAGLEDCYAATAWVAATARELGLDPARVAVGGASSGGNLAAAVAQLARKRGGPQIVFQLLVYPPVDHRAATGSAAEPRERPFFGPDDLAWCWAHYLADPEDGDDPLASPLRAPSLEGLPPALVITAELDPVRDEAERYAARLAGSGVPTELVRFDGAVHGFFSLAGGLDATREAQAAAASALSRAFATAESR
jgi:acetyl esterase